MGPLTPNNAPMQSTGDTSREPFVSVAPKLGFSGPLDGLRGIALLMVLFAHANYANFASFAGSVDMFFVVSGFLITTLILEEHRATSRVNFQQFYLRRVLRLFPVLYLTLAVTLVGGLIWGDYIVDDTAPLRDMVINDVLSAGLYVYHVVHPVGQEVVNGNWPELRPLVHLWSLSVEEHFYLIAAFGTVFVITRRLVKPIVIALLGIWVFVAVARATGHVGWDFMWYQRPDSLLIGVVAAFWNANTPSLSDQAQKRLSQLANVAVLGILFVTFLGSGFARPFGLFVPFSPDMDISREAWKALPDSQRGSLHDGLYWGEFGFSVYGLCMAFVVLSVVRCPPNWLSKFLGWRPWREVGKRSYTLYLLHVPIFVLLFASLSDHLPDGVILVLYLILYPTLSELVHRYVEKPALRLKQRFAHLGHSGSVID